ncbi:MAG: carboxyl-terminal processing protease [Patescibacteria group bacterium]|jgi:carboxyl-terminal processing protease|nr:carboxyl-terminal processing protease [Patescibacteria group bacterium]
MLMEKKVELSRAYVALLVLAVLFIGFVLGTRSQQLWAYVAPVIGINVESGTLNDESLQDAYRTLKSHYNGKIDDDKLIEGAKQGMVAAVGDPYTVYFDTKEADEFNKELSGEIGGGIGAEVGVRNKQPTIIRTLPDNPAEKAGLHAGDAILAVNDEAVEGWDAERTVRVIRGEIGTSVKLTVKRAGEPKEFTITREEINNPSVSSEQRGNVGIVTLNRFDQNTVELVRKTVEDLKQKGTTKLIVDMRGNGGGYLDAAPGVAGMWLNDKLVVSVRANNGGEQKLMSKGEDILSGMKTAVIVNAGSASATEIVAGALKHYRASVIVGEKTFGKGTVQELIPLSNGSLLKVTIKRWYTPSGANVDKNGVKPDVEAGLTQADLDAGKDPQLEAALKAVGAA